MPSSSDKPVQVTMPVAIEAHRFHTIAGDLGRKYRTNTVPTVPHLIVADLDAPLVQQVLDIAQRQGEGDVEHRRQADNLRARLEVAEGGSVWSCR